MKTRNLILSAVLAVWGIAVLIYAIAQGGPAAGGSQGYQSGRVAALVFAVVLVVAGLSGVRTELRKQRQPR